MNRRTINKLLTNREQQILGFVSKGLTSNSIAGKLEISIQTVNTHRKHIWKKLGIHSMTELYQVAIKYGSSNVN